MGRVGAWIWWDAKVFEVGSSLVDGALGSRAGSDRENDARQRLLWLKKKGPRRMLGDVSRSVGAHLSLAKHSH